MGKRELKLSVEGIECPGCAIDMETVLLQLDGVLSVKVNYAKESIAVEYDPDLLSDKQVITAISSLGVKVQRPTY